MKEHHSRLFPWLVFFVALLVRIAYGYLLSRTLAWDAMMVDAELYDNWGMRIAAGDWLGSSIFYDPPLYAYFLGILYKSFGHSYLVVRFVQAVVGALHCVIIYKLASLVSDRKAGLTAGIIACFYGPFIFYDALLMKAFLSSTLADGALLAVLVGIRTGRGRWWLLHGLLLGMGMLLRVNLLAFVIIEAAAFAFLLISGKWGIGRARIFLAAVLWSMGVAIALTPVMVRNYKVGGRAVLVSSYLGQNFYTGNNPFNEVGNYQRVPFVRANPTYEEMDFRAEAVKRSGNENLTPDEVSDFWLNEAWLYIKAQPWAFAGRLILRTRMFFNAYEVPDSYNMGFMSRHILPVLKYLPGFWLVGPLGLLGILLTARRWRVLWPFYSFLLIYMGTIVVFFVFSRYRLSAVGMLVVFGGVALTEAWRRRSDARWIVKVLALLSICATLVNWPPPYKVSDAETMRNLGTLQYKRGDIDGAIDYYRRAIEIGGGDYNVHYFYAHVLREKGDCETAMEQYDLSLRFRPRDPSALAGKAMCLEATGDILGAMVNYSRALKADMPLVEVRMKFIRLLLEAEDYEAAFEQAMRLKSYGVETPEAVELISKTESRLREELRKKNEP